MRHLFVLSIFLFLSFGNGSEVPEEPKVQSFLRKSGAIHTRLDLSKEQSFPKNREEKEAENQKGDGGEENVDDDLQYLSAASGNNRGDTESAEKTTAAYEKHQDLSAQNNREVNDQSNDYDAENTDQDEEDDEDYETAAAPFGAGQAAEKILARGAGSLGDLMFQYATVSSIARSSERRALFSSAFMPLLTLFPNAPLVIIEDEEIEELQPLTNVTLSKNAVSFDSVKQDIPDEASVEIVGQTRSFKYFHVIMNNLRTEFSASPFYISAADDYLEEVMQRALKGKLKDYKEDKNTDENEILPRAESKGFLKFGSPQEEKKEIQDENKNKFGEKNQNIGPQSDKNKDEEEPKSIMEQLRNPADQVTLVGIHVPAILVADDEDRENGNNPNENPEGRKETEKREKERAIIDYFTNAMTYYRDEHSINGDFVQFVIVCEDLRWCVDHLNGPGVHFAVGGSAELDLTILAQCDHAVLTSSSLSWWSAWLTGGQVVYPATLSQINGVALDDYVLPDWTDI